MEKYLRKLRLNYAICAEEYKMETERDFGSVGVVDGLLNVAGCSNCFRGRGGGRLWDLGLGIYTNRASV